MFLRSVRNYATKENSAVDKADAVINKGLKSAGDYTGVIFGLFTASIVGLKCIEIVPAGQVGIVDLFGQVNENTLMPGFHLINPLCKVRHFSLKTQNIEENVVVPTSEGANVGLEVAVLYRLDPVGVRDLYLKVGPDFGTVVLRPQIRSVVRDVVARYEAKSLYSSGRGLIANETFKELTLELEKRGIVPEQILLKKIALPQNLTAAIENKLAMEQESERMKFVLVKERQEAERKKIMAKGIADFQEIVTHGVNEDFLRWKGIEATEKLANSTNAKVVVIGSGKDGLPIILGGGSGKSSSW